MLSQNHFMMKTEVANENKEHKKHLDKRNANLGGKLSFTILFS